MWGDEDATHWHMGHIALAKTVTLAVMGETPLRDACSQLTA